MGFYTYSHLFVDFDYGTHINTRQALYIVPYNLFVCCSQRYDFSSIPWWYSSKFVSLFGESDQQCFFRYLWLERENEVGQKEHAPVSFNLGLRIWEDLMNGCPV